MAKLKYLAGLTVPLAAFASIYFDGGWSYIALIYAFGVLPFLEIVLKPDTNNMQEAEMEVARDDSIYDLMLYIMVPIQFGLLAYFLYTVSFIEVSTFEFIGKTIAMGISCGVLGINVAHELGHRRSAHERVMAKLLLMTSLYMHFIVEHNRGHHNRVATPEDPTSARFGEPLYFFLVRSIVFSYLSSWNLEFNRLEKAGKNKFSIENEILRFTFFQIAFVFLILFVFGPIGVLGFVLAATIGFILLESVNYIEHYGLSRKKISEGRYEKTRHTHSWNSDHPLGRLVLFELTRHSDHHAYSGRKYQVLRHYDDSPQMPAGYPAMLVLSTIPPLWFYVMHKNMKAQNLPIAA